MTRRESGSRVGKPGRVLTSSGDGGRNGQVAATEIAVRISGKATQAQTDEIDDAEAEENLDERGQAPSRSPEAACDESSPATSEESQPEDRRRQATWQAQSSAEPEGCLRSKSSSAELAAPTMAGSR